MNGITIYDKFEQGTEAWRQARCGILTASTMSTILSPKLMESNNEKTRLALYELLAQRITNFVEPMYETFAMERGHTDEIEARHLYSEKYAPVKEVGFITNDSFGFKLGYSPDGLVGDDGLIECKSRMQKHQAKTIIECFANGQIPDEYMLQVQTGLLVSGRKWCDFISYCGGFYMAVTRVLPQQEYIDAILKASRNFEDKLTEKQEICEDLIALDDNLIPTERLNMEII